MSVSSPAPRGIHRRLAFPPPPARPSLAVLRELKGADDDLAWAVFFLSRRVRDVADAPPAGLARWTRAADLRAAAANAPEIAADLLFLGAPEFSLTDRTRGKAAGACHRLAGWAAELGYAELAIQLAEAAIAILPGSARHSYEAGRLNRLFGRFGDAEALYSRAITLARPGKHWWVYVRAHLGLGTICRDKGELDRAAAHYTTAAGAARGRSGEKWLAAAVEHDLFTLAFETGEYELAHHHAVRACEALPTHNEHVPVLVRDYAFFLLRTHAPRLALKLLEPLIEKRLSSVLMVPIWSTLAWSAAALGDSHQFQQGVREVQALAPQFDTHAAMAYIHLAHGAFTLGMVTEAEGFARLSAEIAGKRSEIPMLREAEDILESLQRGDLTSEVLDLPPSEEARRFAESLARRLSTWRGPTWKRKKQASRRSLGSV